MPIAQRFSLSTILILSISVRAYALESPQQPVHPEMRVTLAQSAADDCKADCAEWISLEGAFVKNSLTRFRDVLKKLHGRKPLVIISSGGGDVDTALAMGRLIRSKGLSVAVARTQFDAEPPASDDKGPAATTERSSAPRGRPVSRGAVCASACALLLAAGKERLVSPSVRVGLHEMVIPAQEAMQRVRYFQTRFLKRDGRIVWKETHMVGERSFKRHIDRHDATPENYRKVSAYLKELGLPSKSIVELMKKAPPDKIYWISRTELESTNLMTDAATAESFLGLLPKPAATPLAAAQTSAYDRPASGIKPAIIPTSPAPAALVADSAQPHIPNVAAPPASGGFAALLSRFGLSVGQFLLIVFLVGAMGLGICRSLARMFAPAASNGRSEPPTA
jgi:hypothetical protein